jgi:hypothetical protein
MVSIPSCFDIKLSVSFLIASLNSDSEILFTIILYFVEVLVPQK